MKRLDMKRIAAGLGAKSRGKIAASGGYFGAMALLADVEARFRTPKGGGRATDPGWTEQRLVRLAPRTLLRLKEIAERFREEMGFPIEPMQLAALLLERSTFQFRPSEAEKLLRPDERQRVSTKPKT